MTPELTGDFLSTKFSDTQMDMQMNKQKREKPRRTASEKKVCDLEKQVVENKGHGESIVAEYENARIELEKLYNYVTNGIILRSKAYWYEEGEKNIKYFLSLEKKTNQNHLSGK